MAGLRLATMTQLAAGLLAVTPVFAPAQQSGPAPTASPTGSSRPSRVSGEGAFGTPVPDHPGFVYSPYAPDAGTVDVRGFKSGDEVRCPYTNHLFLVP